MACSSRASTRHSHHSNKAGAPFLHLAGSALTATVLGVDVTEINPTTMAVKLRHGKRSDSVWSNPLIDWEPISGLDRECVIVFGGRLAEARRLGRQACFRPLTSAPWSSYRCCKVTLGRRRLSPEGYAAMQHGSGAERYLEYVRGCAAGIVSIDRVWRAIEAVAERVRINVSDGSHSTISEADYLALVTELSVIASPEQATLTTS